MKAAIINAISWDNGRDNADKYSNFIYKKPLNDLDLDNVPAHDLFSIGYLMAMDNYWEIESAVSVLEKASEAIPDSFTVAMVTAVAKAQVTFGNNEWYKVWGFVDDVITNKNLIKDMRSEAVQIIVNYMIVYKDYTNTEDSEDVVPDLINEDSEDVMPDLINDGFKNLTCYSSDLLRGEFFVESISQLKAYEELEKGTNFRISFVHIPEETLLYKLRVMSLSGDNDDAPDLIEFPWRRHSDLLENLAELDAIIELDELINETAPNLNAILQSNREIKKQVSSDNGHIYQIPKINLADNRVAVGTIIRGDILKKIGVGIPKTILDWEIMLKAMKDSDKSIIPLSLTMGSLENSNSFIGAFGIPFGFGVKDGKVFYGPIEDSYKEFLITFNRWYTNGLIDPDFFLLSKSGLNKKVNSGNVGSFIGSVDNFKVSTDALLSIDSSSELIPAPYPVLQNTDALNVLSSAPVVSEYGITICSPNKYPTETMKLIDYTFSNEGHKLLNYGIEGHTYTINDGQIQYTDLIMNNPDGLSVYQAMLKYLFPLSALNGYNTDESFAKFYIYPQQKNALSLWTVNPGDTNPSCLPTVSLTREEDRELSTIMKSISIYRDEMFVTYTLGVESLESFDKYVGNVNEMGINRAIDILQTALNRYNHRIPILKVNDKTIETDTEPVLFINGETLLPIRFVIESLGGSVAWDGKNKIVTGIWNDTVIILKLNSTDVLVNYEHRTLNQEITVMNKRTYISTDFLEDVLGITIDWDENIRTVIVSSN